MILLLLAFTSPVLATIVLAVAYATARAAHLQKPAGAVLVRAAVKVAAIFVGTALALTILAMVMFELTMNTNSGNAPLGFILIYGPLSAAAGILLVVVGWWLGRPSTYWERQMRPNTSLERTRGK